MEYETSSASALKLVNTMMMWLFCLTVLLLIIPWAEISLTFADNIEDNKILLYFALIIEISNFISQGLMYVVNAISTKKRIKKQKIKVSTAVENLDFAEKALLREYVLQRKSILNLPVLEPTVRNLIDEGVLKIINVTDEDVKTAQIIISREARPYITYKAIGLTLGKMTEDQISEIMNSRPIYAREPSIIRKNKVFVGSKAVNSLYKNNTEVQNTSKEEAAA